MKIRQIESKHYPMRDVIFRARVVFGLFSCANGVILMSVVIFAVRKRIVNVSGWCTVSLEE